MNFELMVDSFPQIVAAIPTTIALVAISLVIGFAIATGLAVMRLAQNRALSAFAYGFVYVI